MPNRLRPHPPLKGVETAHPQSSLQIQFEINFGVKCAGYFRLCTHPSEGLKRLTLKAPHSPDSTQIPESRVCFLHAKFRVLGTCYILFPPLKRVEACLKRVEAIHYQDLLQPKSSSIPALRFKCWKATIKSYYLGSRALASVLPLKGVEATHPQSPLRIH